MTHEFDFSSATSYKWENEMYEYNFVKAKKAIAFLMRVFKLRGYLYLNQVYERFGIEWNPDNENILIRYNECYINEDSPLFHLYDDDNGEYVRIMIDAYYDETMSK